MPASVRIAAVIGSAPIAMPPTEIGHVVGEQIEHSFADEPRALRVERDLPAIEVELRFLARGEREFAEL